MPRLSLYRPEKGNDFRFLDRTINEQFQVGGTDVYLHKYLGVVDPLEGESSPSKPANVSEQGVLGIQDVLFMENRDRHYDPDIYVIRGIYTLSDLDFNLSQFGLFLNNDNIMITFHLSGTFESIGRKIVAGDVIELPHQRDEYALDEDALVALKRFYVVSEVTRPSSGYSQTWYPHLLRAKCSPLIDSQEFKEILNKDSGAGDNSTLRDLLSTYQQNIDINDQVIAQAREDAKLSGYETKQFYVKPMAEGGLVQVSDVSDDQIDASSTLTDSSVVLASPTKNYYVGYLTGDGVPPDGALYSFGITFPAGPLAGQFFLRTDYLPNRLFRYDGKHWIKYEDNVRMTTSTLGETQTNDPLLVRRKLKADFVNNTTTATINGQVVPERQALSKVLKPKADN